MTAATTDLDVRGYLAAVKRYLDDLPDDDRRDLLDDLESHLTEVAAEDEGSLVERLGPPDVYARELRASAGLSAYVAADELTAGERLRHRIRTSPVGALADTAPVRAVRGAIPELRPVWWVVRGYLAAVAIGALFFGAKPIEGPPWPMVDGSWVAGTVLLAVCVLLSVLAGRATRDRERWGALGIVANVVIVLAFLAALPRLQQPVASEAVYMAQGDPFGVLRHADGAPITHLCAYDEDGKRLDDIQLFDQLGRPVEPSGLRVGPLIDRLDERFPFVERKLRASGIAADEDFECPKFDDLDELRRVPPKLRGRMLIEEAPFGRVAPLR